MDDNKTSNQAFLDRFKGKTNKIDKKGMKAILEPLSNPPQVQTQNLLIHKKRLASLDSKTQISESNKNSKDILIHNNPQPKYMLGSLNPRSKSNKFQAASVHYNIGDSPLVLNKKQLQMSTILPPSRSTSQNTEGIHRRVFGKYLKLDQQALKHFQFLKQIDRRRAQRRKSTLPYIN